MADEEKPASPPPAEDSGASLESGADEGASLETTGGDDGVTDATSASDKAKAAAKPAKKSFFKRFNIYLIFFLFILVIAGVIIIIAYFQSKQASTSSTLKTQSLTQQTLEQVAQSDATVGNSQQILNVQSSAVFAGKVLVQEDLEIAGNLQIGGTVALTSLAVAGTSSLSQVDVSKDLAVSGDAAIQGAMTISKSLQVNGGGTFSGAISAPQITTSTFNLNSDLVLTHHISAGGPTPGRSNGTALGSGGTASVSGSDTSGSVSINTGSSPPAGCFVTINFATKFNDTPHVLITPIGSAAGSIPYYVTRNSSSFSICDSSTPPTGSSFGFDYFVVD